MRNFISVTLLLVMLNMLLIKSAHAFEIEDELLFEVPEPVNTLRILSNTDLIYFKPLVDAFQKQYSSTNVLYTVASSTELYKAVYEKRANYDLVISSAMDLQVKLVNDGLSIPHQSRATDAMPAWSKWRNHLFAFTQEPAVLVASKAGMGSLPLPENRQQLISLIRDNPEHFEGKIGTYDIRTSGAGYLFATQDARQSDAYWRLAEVIGSLSPRLYCCTSNMLQDLESGKIALAYNVVGSYASAALNENSASVIVPMFDYTHFMLRSALIPADANNPELSGLFIDFLSDDAGRNLIKQQAGLPPVNGEELARQQHFRPISLGPGLLVYLDKIKRQHFLKDWVDAMVQ